jgi:hypothetical protein
MSDEVPNAVKRHRPPPSLSQDVIHRRGEIGGRIDEGAVKIEDHRDASKMPLHLHLIRRPPKDAQKGRARLAGRRS